MRKDSIKINSVLNSMKSLLQVVFPLITFPYVSRVLQVEGMGKVSFSSSVMSYFSMIASLGVSTYAIRECAKVKEDKQKLRSIASEIFTINMITTLVSYAALFLMIFFASSSGV